MKGGFDDTRGTLFFDILRILKIKKPKCFLLENVKNLKGHDGGRTLQVILSSLRQMYYVPVPQVLNAKDFGVPQNRQRIFIVGFLKKHVIMVIFEYVFFKIVFLYSNLKSSLEK